ncbi:MAG: hypothetical protein COB49_01525 [Alphaproteobacteria bacterium]|nr:MAG: hypothetical protein COB49_01525 [Alphaproteobacteria bacterium]
MDLLKDKGFAPQTDMNTNNVVSAFKGLVARLSSKIEQPAGHYDFMDLMRDSGFIPEPSNDNGKIPFNVVSIVNEMAGKLVWNIEMPVEHHDFMDLLHDKGFVPAHSNDNDLNVQVA